MMKNTNKIDSLKSQIEELEVIAKISRLKFEIVECDYKRLLYLKMLNNGSETENNNSSQKTKDN